MSLHHDRNSLLEEIRHMPKGMFTDGVLVDCPKRRRREQAMGTRPMVIKWPPEQKKRFGTQYNRYVEIFGKDLALEIILKLLEQPDDELLRSWAE